MLSIFCHIRHSENLSTSNFWKRWLRPILFDKWFLLQRWVISYHPNKLTLWWHKRIEVTGNLLNCGWRRSSTFNSRLEAFIASDSLQSALWGLLLLLFKFNYAWKIDLGSRQFKPWRFLLVFNFNRIRDDIDRRSFLKRWLLGRLVFV